MYHRCVQVFEALPLAAVVTTNYGRFLCVHGGIGPSLKDLAQIDALDRFREPPMNGLLCDLLWADPLKDCRLVKKGGGGQAGGGTFIRPDEVGDFLDIDFMSNPVRGCSHYYGYRAVETCVTQSCSCLGRAPTVARCAKTHSISNPFISGFSRGTGCSR